MPKAEWGAKHRCEKCDTRFYDLLRNPIVCPNCGEPVLIGFSLDLGLDDPLEDAVVSDIVVDLDEDDEILKTDEEDGNIEESDDVMDDSDTVSLEDIKNVSTDDTS